MAADVAEVVWYNEDAASPLTVSKPAAFASGQILIAVVHQHGATGHVTDITAPTGWTQVGGDLAGTDSQGRVFYLVFTGGLPSTWDFPYYTNADTCIGLFRVTGADTTPTITVASATSASIGATFDSPTVTPAGADDLLICTIGDIADGNSFAATAPAGMTTQSSTQIAGGFMALAGASQQLASGSATGAKTWTSISPTGHAGGSFSVVIKSVAAATTIPYATPRLAQARDYGEAWWLQRPRRDTALVAAAANDLATPLLVPTGAQVWHTTARDRRYVPQQRPYVSDPSLLTPDVYPLGSADDLRRRQQQPATHAPRIWAPQQRALQSEPTMLATALLEGALLGGATTAMRNLAATHVDRRLTAYQPPRRSEPTLLTTAQLDELLGSADVARRVLMPATHVDRRYVPQQRAYVSDPALLLTALLEAPLLGGRPASVFSDRRVAPVQPARFNPDLLAVAAESVPVGLDRRYVTAVTHADRRQVAAQPARVVLVFDAGPGSPPLTGAWGVGGTYWHLYHRAAEAYDRRWPATVRFMAAIRTPSAATGLIGDAHGPLPQMPGSAAPPAAAGLRGAIT